MDDIYEAHKSQVYVQADGQGRITRCEGGYTMDNIKDIDGWTLIDEGHGDRYNLCQSHYLEDGLYTWDGISLWRLERTSNDYGFWAVRRTEAEIAADRAALTSTPAAPTEAEQLRADVDFLAAMTGVSL